MVKKPSVRADVLYFPGCPNHRPTVDLVREILAELEVESVVREIEVRTLDEARRLRFLGSPTVRVDGVDIEPDRRRDEAFAMVCRVYGGSGRPPTGVPSRELVVSALTGGRA